MHVANENASERFLFLLPKEGSVVPCQRTSTSLSVVSRRPLLLRVAAAEEEESGVIHKKGDVTNLTGVNLAIKSTPPQ